MDNNRFKLIGKIIFLPILFYFFFYIVLTFPAITKFSTHFICGTDDGMMNIWDIWWFNKAVTELHINPWHCNYLYYPFGVSLLGHSLNAFDCFMGMLLLKIFSITQTHNFLIVFSFVMSGFTAFLLSFYISSSYLGSFVAGFIYAFSSYHIGHSQEHLNLIGEGIPLFILGFLILMDKPSIRFAIFSALTLFIVILTDYYYFFYCGLTAVIIYIWQAIKRKNPLFLLTKDHLIPFINFIVFCLITSGIIVINLVLLNLNDPLLGGHDSSIYSTDLLSPFIPSAFWRFGYLTKIFWSKLPGNEIENSVYVGWTVIFFLVYTIYNRKSLKEYPLGFLFTGLTLFFLLSLGPKLHIYGKYYNFFMPYSLLELVIPSIKISGCPVRMMIMVFLFAGAISAISIKDILSLNKPGLKRIFLPLILAILILEYLPSPASLTRIEIPAYVLAIKRAKTKGGVLDLTETRRSLKMYYQTIYDKPMAFGHLSRVPTSVNKKAQEMLNSIYNKETVNIFSEYKIEIVAGGKINEENVYILNSY